MIGVISITGNEKAGTSTAVKHFNEGEIKTKCGGNCGYCPTVIVPGIGQSRIHLLDGGGNRVRMKGLPGVNFPVDFRPLRLAVSLALPALKMIVTRKDTGFSDKAAKAFAGCFTACGTAADGRPVNRIEVERYLKSAAACSKEERDFINSCIPLGQTAAETGEDHIYFHAYNYFGNNREATDGLYDMIRRAKKETGHDKVNLVAVSLGGSIAVSLLHFYPRVADDLNKILFIVPGLDGTKLFADIYGGNFVSDDSFYRGRLTSRKGVRGLLLKAAAGLVPRGVFFALVEKIFDALRSRLLLGSTVMWGAVPDEDYPALADRFLSGPETREVRRQADLYREARAAFRANIRSCAEAGVKVFDIVDYNYPLMPFVNASKIYNGDGWVNIESASLGATAGPQDTPLPEGYRQQNTFCADPAHNHISPDGIVDASTGFLPETTFYFRNQNHELTGENPRVAALVNEILLRDTLEDVHSAPDRFPQFDDGGRE